MKVHIILSTIIWTGIDRMIYSVMCVSKEMLKSSYITYLITIVY